VRAWERLRVRVRVRATVTVTVTVTVRVRVRIRVRVRVSTGASRGTRATSRGRSANLSQSDIATKKIMTLLEHELGLG